MTDTFSFRWGVDILDSGHTTIPNLFLANYSKVGVTRDEMMVIIHLASFAWERPDSECRPSIAKLAEQAGYTPRGLRMVLRRLEKRGLLVCHQRPGRTTLYDLSPFSRKIMELTPSPSLQDGSVAQDTTTSNRTVTPECTFTPERAFTPTPERTFPPPRNARSPHEESVTNNTHEEARGSGAEAPPAPAPPRRGSRTPKPKTPIPEAVEVFRAETNRFPPKSWFPTIAEAVGADPPNLDRWRRVVHAWVGTGYNPTNVQGMLECYRRGDMPGTVPKAPNTSASGQTILDRNLETLEHWAENAKRGII